MSRLLPFFVTAALALSSIWAGIDSYLRTETTIARDLTRALTLTAQEQPVDWLSTDTIRTFRSHLQMGELRENAYLAFCLMDQRRQQAAGTVASDTLVVTDHVLAQGYATCSAFAIWRMSDQRLSAVLALLTCIMLCMCLQKTRKVQIKLADAPSSQEFASLSLFTPLQSQLLDLLLASPTHELTKQEICDALWPRKDNASETLYTLIHRIKPVLDQHTGFRIVSNRGRSYRLEQKPASELTPR